VTERKVLLADDDDDLRSVLAEILADEGLRPVEAPDGTTALAKLRACACDAAVLDQRMPGLTGADVLRRARAEGIGTPTVLITAAGDVASIAGDLGVRCFLGKPFSIETFVAAVRRALSNGC